ncbi:Hsp20 family protein, partial [Clostridium sporogenes]|uniref:Hsp20 family protein n=1 Tax=Clostridium sporogenes TaxID=1509 RepID=UPI002237A821
ILVFLKEKESYKEKFYDEKESNYKRECFENNIDASFKDGVLKINLPKLDKENSNEKRIDIH